MATTTADNIQIIGGVDTHQDLHTAAVVSHDGTVLGTESFSTTRAGYRAMLRWFRSHGELLRVGVESTGTYGAGITRHLALSGIPVLEVTGPDPASRRAKGKDDALDAIFAVEAARTRRRVQVAKDRSGTVEALRVLRTTRKTAIKCRRAALQQLHNTIVAAPEEVRDQVRNLTRMQRLRTCAAWRPDCLTSAPLGRIEVKGFSLCFRSHQMLIVLLRSRHGFRTVPGDVRELLDLGK